MVEYLFILKVVVYALLIGVLCLLLRFLWQVPSSLKSLVFYAEMLYEKFCGDDDIF